MNDIMSQAVDVVVLVAAVCVALTNIYRFFKKPVDTTREKLDENRKKHDEELTQNITASVMDQVEPLMSELKDINLAQSAQINLLKNGQLDLLRQQILYLYTHHNTEKTLTKDEMEQLHKLFQDYTASGGNSFVQSLYEQMSKWDIVG